MIKYPVATLFLPCLLFACAHGGAGGSSGGMSEEGANCLVLQFQSDPSAEQVCTTSCKGGNGESCTTLGSMFERGHGVKADPTKALAMYDRGCELGDAEGCFDAGRKRRDDGDKVAAIGFFERACTKDKLLAEHAADACFTAGDAYYTGASVPKDPAKAEPLLKRACEKGNMAACDRFDFKPKQ